MARLLLAAVLLLAPALCAAAEGPVDVLVWLKTDRPASSEVELRASAARQRHVFRASMSATGAQVVRDFRSIPALVVRIEAAKMDAIAENADVLAIAEEQYGSAALTVSVSQIGAAQLHERGWTGEGAVLALLDTGVDADHPDIAGRVLHEECVCAGCCGDGKDHTAGPGSAHSTSSHGPHVAGIMASAGAVSPVGVAPAAELVVMRVLNDDNRGSVFDWLAALDIILADHPEVGVVNMSLVSDSLYTPDCSEADAFTMAFADIAGRLRRRGTLIVAAAGNRGSRNMLPAPACLRDVVSTGAVNSRDEIAGFSNTAQGLDLLAPGVAILSDAAGGDTTVFTGTSMAAPHVSGSLALLLHLVGRPLLAALPGVLRANGVPIEDRRVCSNGACLRVPRVDVNAAGEWLEGILALRPGGGSSAVDCQAEWRTFLPLDVRSLNARRLRCRDGDISCDTDDLPGQCTFSVQVCFNVPDRRLPTCDPLQTIDAYRVRRPSLQSPVDDLEFANALRFFASLPALAIEEAGQCGSYFDFVVPSRKARPLVMATETERGTDIDRFRFSCAP